jgi:WXXGXW repeat (2 copies)
MKKIILIFAVLATFMVFTGCAVGYVSEEPTYQEIRSVRPSATYVWVEGNWVWSRQSHSYNHSGGRWIVPTRNRTYEPGRWNRNSHGSRWQRGRWR